MRVLLAEDEAGVRLMIASGLARAGYDVIEASDGSAALRLLEEGTLPDILITDIRMPGADGWTVARAYRARLPDLPVLYVTGFADENNPVPGGVILPKPFRAAQLPAALASLQQAHSPAVVGGMTTGRAAAHVTDRRMQIYLPDEPVQEMTLSEYQNFLERNGLVSLVVHEAAG